MLTNIVKEDTELLCFGEKAKRCGRCSAFQLPSDMEDIVLKGLVSRKKQLIPSIVTVLQQIVNETEYQNGLSVWIARFSYAFLTCAEKSYQ